MKKESQKNKSRFKCFERDRPDSRVYSFVLMQEVKGYEEIHLGWIRYFSGDSNFCTISGKADDSVSFYRGKDDVCEAP